MLKTIEEISEVEIEAGVVVNGVDNANMMSIDSTEPIKTDVEKEKKSKEDIDADETDKSDEKKEVEKSETTKVAEVEEKGKKSKDDSVTEDKDQNKSEDSKTVQKRIGKLTKQWRTAERERDFEKIKRTELEEKLKELESKIPAEGKPVKVDYDDEDEYIEALTDWKIDVKLKASQKSVGDEIKNVNEKKAVDETYEGLDDAMENGKEKFKDFNELVLNEDLIISPEVTQILLGTENPEDLMYYLGSNPEESERLSKLDPIRAALEIGKINVGLVKEEKEKEKEKETPKAKPKKQSNAPEPINSLRTDGVVEKDPNKMSVKEYKAWREGQ